MTTEYEMDSVARAVQTEGASASRGVCWPIALLAAIVCAALACALVPGCTTYTPPMPTDAQIQAAFDAAIEAVAEYQASHTNESPVVTLPESTVEIQTVGDEVKFSDMRWTFGGFKGAKAISDAQVMIGKLKIAGKGMSYEYMNGSSLRGWGFERSWGMADTSAEALACLFVQRSDGIWVGGKFDWISTSRKTRKFTNVFNGYHGWTLDGVPNPCKAAFCIVNPATGARTNVIAGDWKR